VVVVVVGLVVVGARLVVTVVLGGGRLVVTLLLAVLGGVRLVVVVAGSVVVGSCVVVAAGIATVDDVVAPVPASRAGSGDRFGAAHDAISSANPMAVSEVLCWSVIRLTSLSSEAFVFPLSRDRGTPQADRLSQEDWTPIHSDSRRVGNDGMENHRSLWLAIVLQGCRQWRRPWAFRPS